MCIHSPNNIALCRIREQQTRNSLFVFVCFLSTPEFADQIHGQPTWSWRFELKHALTCMFFLYKPSQRRPMKEGTWHHMILWRKLKTSCQNVWPSCLVCTYAHIHCDFFCELAPCEWKRLHSTWLHHSYHVKYGSLDGGVISWGFLTLLSSNNLKNKKSTNQIMFGLMGVWVKYWIFFQNYKPV